MDNPILKLRDDMLYSILDNKSEAKFAHKVMDIIIKRNPKDIYPWQDGYDVNERLTYLHMETEFKSSIHAEVEIMSLYKTIFGEMSEELEKEIDKSAEYIANHKLVSYGWIKDSTNGHV